MSEQIKKNIAVFVNMRIPLDYVEVYFHILAALSDYGEDMLKDCKASCTDKDSGIIECFNMFNSACSLYELGDDVSIKKANLIFDYIESQLNLKYKDVTMPDVAQLPVEGQNVTVYFDFKNKSYYVEEGTPIPVQSIRIEGNNNITGINYQYECLFIPDDTTQRNVVWSIISGNNYATIDSTTGELTIFSNAHNSLVTIKAEIPGTEVYDTKEIVCTYSNEAVGVVTVTVDTTLVEFGTQKEVIVHTSGTNVDPINLQLHKLDSSGNDNLLNTIPYSQDAVFNITVEGEYDYFVRANFADGKQLNSEIFTLVGIPCCYIGEADKNVGYGSVINNPSCKLNPILDIGSPLGEEYDVTVTEDGHYIYIIVPVFTNHMNISEIRLDESNLSTNFEFDIPEGHIITIEFNGFLYKVYPLELRGNGFVSGNYRLLIVS